MREKNKKKIFALLGKSNSGKTTIYKMVMELIQKDRVPVYNLNSCTTRPMREEDVNGSEYTFLTKSDFTSLHKSDSLLEYTVYETAYGQWFYFTRNKDLINDYYIKIINPSGLSQIKDSSSKIGYDVISFYIDSDNEVRLERSLKRNDGLSKEEIIRRFKADEKDFKYLKTDYVISNNGEQSLEDISNYIYEKIKECINID